MWYLTISKATQAPEKLLENLEDHLAWMKRQHADGNVLISGPTSDRKFGIIVIKAHSLDAAQEILATEPFIASGLREYEIYEWEAHQMLGIGQFEFQR